MKLPVLVTALALACGTALAAGSSYSDRDTSTTTRQPSAAVSNDTQPKEGFIDKTKRAFHRLGEKMRSATHRNSTQEAKKDDTRSMGAAGSDSQDSSRQRRMDDAYGNWKSKQK